MALRLFVPKVALCVRIADGRCVNVVLVTERRKWMAYTPELSHEASCTLRRLSWSMGKPMTETMEWVFSDLVKFIPSQAVCEGCKDKSKCGSCSFNSKGKQGKVLLNKKGGGE